MSNNDDDDVIMGQAVTPLKSAQFRNDPMGPSLTEDIEPPYKDDYKSPISNIKTSDLSLTSPESIVYDSSLLHSFSSDVTSSKKSKNLTKLNKRIGNCQEAIS